ncbi:MAG: alpha/beta hydrolase [Myxococcota bacterium]
MPEHAMPQLYLVKKMVEAVLGSAFAKSAIHRGIPTPNPILTPEERYPPGSRSPVAANQHGEVEVLPGGVDAIHWFVEASGMNWHFVTAGDPTRECVVLLHGLPESWYAWHRQIAALSKHFYVVAPDTKGYGQTDKRLELDYRHETMAQELADLIDKLGIERFNLAGHDRGAVLADHLLAVQSMKGRVLRYVRMQQTAVEPHSPPVPPHHLFATRFGRMAFRSNSVPRLVFTGDYVKYPIDEDVLRRLEYEFKFEGTAEAVSKYFATTNFEIELHDRHKRLFKYMTMPVLFLQGTDDPGQRPSEYERVSETVPTGRVQFIDAGHFFHLERPEATNAAILEFLRQDATGSSS